MRLGFVTFEGMEYDTSIRAAQEMGFDFIELQMTYVAAGKPILGREFLANHQGEIVELLEKTGIDLMIHLPHTMDIGAASPGIRSASIEETELNIEVAHSLGAEKCVIHPVSSARARGWDKTTLQNFIINSMNELISFAEDIDIELCLENLRTGVFKAEDFPRFFEATNGSMTLDTGHARITGMKESTIASFIQENLERIGHIHASDNKQYVTGFDGVIGDDHAPTGVGDLDFSTALSTLPRDWDGTISLEIHTQAMDYLSIARNHFRNSIDVH